MKKIVMFSVLIFFLASLTAQERLIKGLVTTFDSIPLINAQLRIKSSKQIVTSDTLGKFQLTCLPEEKIKVSAEGFITQNVKINDKTKILLVNLKLKPNPKSAQIAVGYGHVKDEQRLNAISSLNNSDLDFSNYSNMYELIRGRFAGVQIVNGEIIIRGQNSINSSNAALIVVDGNIVDQSILDSLSPVDVKRIDVLKDAGSAIYGSRGANGVVIIETKRGGQD